MKRISLFLGTCVLLCSLLSGCEKEESSSAPYEIIGSDVPYTEEVTPFPYEVCGINLTKSVQRVVSLSPAVTEILSELGFSEKIVGISDYCDYPDNLTAKRVGSAENPDINAILQLAPDAIFTLSPLSERESYQLSQAKIAVLNLTVPTSVDGYAAMYSEIAGAFYGRETIGEKEQRRTDKVSSDAVKNLETAAEKVSLETFVYVTEKLTLAGADTFENAVLSLAGENLCELEGYVSAESCSGIYPKYIIVDDNLSLNTIRTNSVLKAMTDNGANVCFVSSQFLERPTLRTAGVFSRLAEQSDSVTSE